MKKLLTILLPIAIVFTSSVALTGCKKGEDDPLISLKSRTARISQFWTLVEFKENGNTQSLADSEFTWDIRDNGNITETVEGDIFGVQTTESETGSWDFQSDKEDLLVTFESGSSIYQIDRLSSKDLWIRETDGDDVYEMIFENR